MSVQRPAWNVPTRQIEEPVLKVYNSLTKTKTEFIPRNGRLVKWYNCGPTVYDASHMGHARNYITQDILRRIVSDYFGYDVHFVMNITDIDDKIILRARQNYLFDNFRTQTSSLTPDLVVKVQDAWQSHVLDKVSKGLPDSIKPTAESIHTLWPQIEAIRDDKVQKAECLKRDEKFEMNLGTAIRTASALSAARKGQKDRESALILLDESRDILSASLDKELKDTVTDPSIFRALAAFWENQFFRDMDRLRVRRPDTLTRVTEYVPEIVEFVKRIVENGYAYEYEGSVYFDTVAFDSSENHTYAKLEPWSKGNRELLAEGEGVLSITTGKRSASDFALWKASKPGEPSWPSPWGPGRPGWHIECSVMASAVFGDNMDIHSGGIDLAFPHHDNEMAQSEAYHECGAWVNYFIHTGHLHIEGLKMSKSLKNFITIDDILQRFTPRQLRLAFLSQLWNAKVDFSESLMTGEVKTIESTFNNFFATVKALLMVNEGNQGKSDGYHHYEEPEREVTNGLNESKLAFRSALCDSFNTPEGLKILRDLVSRTNVYINTRTKSLNVVLVEQSARWQEELLLPYLRALSSFRDGVRQLAIAKGDNSLKDILKLCDRLRDEDLVPLGVALDDQEDGKALLKLVPPSELIKARDEKRHKLEAQAARKAALAQAGQDKRLAKLEKGRTPPEEFFKPPNASEGEWSQWNEQGIPTVDGEGRKLSKNQEKKLSKQWTDQKRLHEEFLAWQQQQQ
ncbi:cysteine-tRNA ligase [Lanmaoa asiatica]|nr:cysteine-tRNA ligase [Lanmaoa asiatica]